MVFQSNYLSSRITEYICYSGQCTDSYHCQSEMYHKILPCRSLNPRTPQQPWGNNFSSGLIVMVEKWLAPQWLKRTVPCHHLKASLRRIINAGLASDAFILKHDLDVDDNLLLLYWGSILPSAACSAFLLFIGIIAGILYMHLNKLTQLGLSSDKVGTCGFNPGRAQHCSVSLDSAL